MCFRSASLQGSSQQDSPSLAGWRNSVLGDLGVNDMGDNTTTMEFLRRHSDVPRLDAYQIPPEALRAFSIAMGAFILDGIHGLWYDEHSDGHKPNRLAITLGTRAAALCNLYDGHAPKSPIEAQLACALLWQSFDWAGFPHVDFDHSFADRDDVGDAVETWITTQAAIAGYKVDLLIWFAVGKARGGLAIECDGHAFHERTKEQAAKDRKRDRDLLVAGYPVMRFTGSEIYADPVQCASQVYEAASGVLERVSQDGGLF